MSTVIQIGPVVVAEWATITAVVVSALDRLGFETVAEEADTSAQVNRAEIEVENSEILAGAAGTKERLVVDRDGVRAVFSRDARGRSSFASRVPVSPRLSCTRWARS